jgi:hypothetical protein
VRFFRIGLDLARPEKQQFPSRLQGADVEQERDAAPAGA